MKLILLWIVMMGCCTGALAASEVRLHGTLVSEPCMLEPDQEALQLDFGDVIAKVLYSAQRTLPRPLTLTLSGCDADMGQSVELSFSGNADADQPELLALSGAATAKGVAIGLSDAQGTTVPINKGSLRFPLQKGSNTLHFAAWLQASEQAIKQRQIEPGNVAAIATFYLTYP